MQGSRRETAHSWGIVGIQFDNHREQGANSRDSERQQQGRRGCFPGGPFGATGQTTVGQVERREPQQ